MLSPINKKLYEKVKKMANKKFQSKTGVYRSSWIVKEYKRLGGKYKGKHSDKLGLKRWYKEKWVDLNRPIKNIHGHVTGYEQCGRKDISKNPRQGLKYPLCRPSKKISPKTPKTYQEISTKNIQKAKRKKSKLRYKGNVQFGRGEGPEIKELDLDKNFTSPLLIGLGVLITFMMVS